MRLACEAEILSSRREGDAARLAQLSALPGYETVDTLEAQIADLIRMRHPARKFEPAQLGAAVAEFVAKHGAAYGAWIHYPWSRRLVRLLEEEDFVALRTNRNQLKITAQEQARLRSKKVGVVGLSVGQSVALTLALERSCGELRLADFDTIDLSNLNRLRCGVHSIGLPKTVVAAREIAELDPYLKVVCYGEGYTEETAAAFLEGLDAVVDECDSLDVKLRLRESARARRIPVLMNTSDRGMTDIERFDLERARPPFHGHVGDVTPESLAGLSTEEKVPVVLGIIGLSTASTRLKASMLEIEQSIVTWPQLASDVTLGGAAICDATRRLLLGSPVASGRYYLDLASIGQIASAAEPTLPEPIPGKRASCRETPPADPLDRILADASMAPSAGNAQPWQWRKQAHALVLQRRGGPANSLDPDGKAATVGLGATLESAVISARHHGYAAEVRIDTAEAAHRIASLMLSADASAGDEPLYAQLTRRRSVRSRPQAPGAIADADLAAMAAQALRFPGLRVTWLTERDAVDAIGMLAGEAERLRFLDPRSHTDLLREIAWSYSEHQQSGEGLPIDALGLSAGEEAGLHILRDAEVAAKLAEWNLGSGLAKLSRDLIRSSTAVGLLWSEDDSQATYLDGGRALQRLWLQATQSNIGLCPVVTLCYMLGAWRAGRQTTPMQARGLPGIEREYRELFGLPAERADIALFRLVPDAEALDRPRVTLRRPA